MILPKAKEIRKALESLIDEGNASSYRGFLIRDIQGKILRKRNEKEYSFQDFSPEETKQFQDRIDLYLNSYQRWL